MTDEEENPYLLLGFWRFAILSTLMVAFFPWSLLFCVVFYGIDETILICAALIHDLVKTILAVLAILISLAVPLVIISFSLGN